MSKRAICDDCYYPYEKWDDSPPKKGKVYTCECGAKYISGNRISTRIYHTVLRKGEISTTVEGRECGVWKVEKTSKGEMLYVTCPDCGEINNDDAEEIDRDGYVGGKEKNTCFECSCGHHFWPFLKDWKRSRRVR